MDRPNRYGCSTRRGLSALLERVACFSVRRRREILVAAVLVVIVSVPSALGLSSRLVNGGWISQDSASARARTLLDTKFHAGPADVLLLVRADTSVDSAPARQAGAALTDRLRKQPGVTGLESYWTGYRAPKPTAAAGRSNAAQLAAADASRLRSADGRTALVAVRLEGDTHQRRITTDRILSYANGRHGSLLVQAAGAAVVSRALGEQSERDLVRTEMLALPATLLLLVLIFGSVPAACLPLAVGLVATSGSAALLRALTTVTEVSTFALNVTTAVGLALSADYSLFLVTRYREDITAGYTHDDALNRCVRTAGRIVVVSAAAVALSLLGLLFFPLYFLRSLAYASISVAILAAAASLLIVPAGLACFGHRIGRGDVLARWRRRTSSKGGGAWQRLALAVMRRPVSVTVASAGLLAALVLPFHHAAFGFSDERGLPPDAPVAQAARALRSAFPQPGTQIDVVLPGRRRAAESNSPGSTTALDAYARSLSRLPGVQALRTATGEYLNGAPASPVCHPPANTTATSSDCPLFQRYRSPSGVWLSITTSSDTYAPATVDLVRRIRALPAPVRPLIGGPTAEFLDTRTIVSQRMPAALILATAATFLLLLAYTRSLFLPLKALCLNLLSLTATFGAMVLIFQDGHLRWLVGDFVPTGTIDVMMPIVVFCLAFGLSMDYEILLLSRIMEARTRTRDTVQATAAGLQAAAPLFIASAALVVTVLLALATAEVVSVKLIAVCTTLSVLLDTVLIRPLLVPAVMKLAGSANWWLPHPLHRILPPRHVPATVPGRFATSPPASPSSARWLDDR
ncbi:MMPL family transporter [Streptomyces sirii]|uniref:MMPL family transporter n=1 Tax=Streptomyces sirii TaxID=3127701 RepID=UPI003D35C253